MSNSDNGFGINRNSEKALRDCADSLSNAMSGIDKATHNLTEIYNTYASQLGEFETGIKKMFNDVNSARNHSHSEMVNLHRKLIYIADQINCALTKENK